MHTDFSLLLPEFLLAGLALAVLVVDMALPQALVRRRSDVAAIIATVGMALVLAVTLLTARENTGFLYEQLLFTDRFALLFKVLFLGTGIAVSWMSQEYVGAKMRHPGEFHALVVLAVLGAGLMASAGELLTAYISIELLAFALYVLVGLGRGDMRSAEAVTKYVLLGAVSSAVMLFGISLLYGATGQTAFRYLEGPLDQVWAPVPIVGFAFLVAGLGFKLSAVPFHLWTPDVYEGAPTPVTALISVLSKSATVALVVRFLAEGAMGYQEHWQVAMVVLAVLTMTVGTLTAMAQTNVKRLLAYSSITQVGFVLVGLAALSEGSANAIALHLAGYAFTNLAAFTVVSMVEVRAGRESIAGYAGLASASPFSAMVLTAALFSLAGLPIFAGFITKFALFTAAAQEGLLWLVGVAVLASLVSLYYYLRIVRAMYVDKAEAGSPLAGRLRLSPVSAALAWVLLAGTVAVGVYPGPLAGWIAAATDALGPFLGA
jgi:NADH-quinone oxidoreductase subunit N